MTPIINIIMVTITMIMITDPGAGARPKRGSRRTSSTRRPPSCSQLWKPLEGESQHFRRLVSMQNPSPTRPLFWIQNNGQQYSKLWISHLHLRTVSNSLHRQNWTSDSGRSVVLMTKSAQTGFCSANKSWHVSDTQKLVRRQTPPIFVRVCPLVVL